MERYSNKFEYYSSVVPSQLENVYRDKPVVHYIFAFQPPRVNERASVIPVDHPAVYLNGQRVSTSAVVSVAEDGNSFETLNTKYVYQPINEGEESNGSSLSKSA